jgi:serine/threonine protein kinase
MIPNNKLDPQAAIAFSVKIAKGIQVLHTNKITHRDLKPDNILLVRKYKPGFDVP